MPWSSHPNLAILTLHDQIVSDQSGSQLLSYIYCNGNSEVDFLVFTVATVHIHIPNLATESIENWAVDQSVEPNVVYDLTVLHERLI